MKIDAIGGRLVVLRVRVCCTTCLSVCVSEQRQPLEDDAIIYALIFLLSAQTHHRETHNYWLQNNIVWPLFGCLAVALARIVRNFSDDGLRAHLPYHQKLRLLPSANECKNEKLFRCTTDARSIKRIIKISQENISSTWWMRRTEAHGILICPIYGKR